MRLGRVWRDVRGVTAVEFAITAPVFFAIIFGMFEVGLLLWTQLGLQHGVEAAARCASVNATLCSDAASIRNYAAGQAFGLNPDPSTFTVSNAACGNQVSASYTFVFVTAYFPAPTLAVSAQACFPN
jgi:Flp pilus assembly protein TadG